MKGNKVIVIFISSEGKHNLNFLGSVKKLFYDSI